MDVLANAFEWVVLSITAVMVFALAAFIGLDALADRRRRIVATEPKAPALPQSSQQSLWRASKRRSKNDRPAATQAA